MIFRRRKRPQRESLVAREARIRKVRTQTQGWDRYRVVTLPKYALERIWVGQQVWAGDRLVERVAAIKEGNRPHPMRPSQEWIQVFYEKPWEYADLGPQFILDPKSVRMADGYTVMGHKLV